MISSAENSSSAALAFREADDLDLKARLNVISSTLESSRGPDASIALDLRGNAVKPWRPHSRSIEYSSV
jgi:hypothetical protein